MKKIEALANYLGVQVSDIQEDDYFAIPSLDEAEYEVYTDEEATDLATERILGSLCYFSPGFLATYTGLSEAVFLALNTPSANEAIESLIDNAGSIDEFVQESIDADGRAHFVSNYDDVEIELDGGYYAYRIN